MVTKSPENNTTAETENNIIKPIISTVGTPISESPEGKKITTNTQKNTSEVKKEIKTQFDIISENTEYNEILQDLIDGTAFYIDSQLGKDFSKIEKDNIKLVLLSYLTEKVNNIDLSIINGIKNGIEKKLKGILDSFKNKEDNDVKKENFNSLFETLGINGLQKNLDDKIVQIKDDRENKKFREIGEAFDSIEGVNKPEGKIFDNIQAELKKASQKFDKFSDIGKRVKGTADKLGMEDILQDVILWLKKEFPFLGSILTMFLGGIESNGGDKKEKSTANLTKFIKNKKKSPLDKIEENKDLKIKSQDLEDFYKSLDGKKIDYSKKNFWEGLLTGKTEDSEIKNLNFLLINSLKNGETLKKINLETLVNRLTLISKITKKEAQTKELKNSNTTKERKIEIEEEIKTEKSFSKLLKEGFIMVDGNKENISIENNNIKIGDQEYSISIDTFLGNKFEGISLKNGELTVKANGETVTYGIEKAKPILEDLIKYGSYSKKIEDKPATLKIQKA